MAARAGALIVTVMVGFSIAMTLLPSRTYSFDGTGVCPLTSAIATKARAAISHPLPIDEIDCFSGLTLHLWAFADV
jgi:hypothetical protein